MTPDVQTVLTGIVRPVYIPGAMHLSDYMAEKNLSDEQVAEAIRRSRVTVSRIRRKKTRPDWATIDVLREWSGGKITADDFQSLEAAE